jgi:hypothetical protein
MEKIMHQDHKSFLKKVIQVTLKIKSDDIFDAESRLAGVSSAPGFISGAIVASQYGGDKADTVISYHEISQMDKPDGKLPVGMRYAWI